MNDFLKLLLAFLTLAVGPGPGDDDDEPDLPDATGAPAEPTDDDDSLDDLIEFAEDSGGKPKADEDETPALKEARRREKEARDEAERERAARYDAERRIPQGQPSRDTDAEAEERYLAELRSGGATAEQLAWAQWKVGVDRGNRATTRESRSALIAAQDLADKTAFERLEVTKPKVFKAYADRVEQAMQKMRSQGQNAPRLAVLRLLIGDDIMNGSIKSKSAKSKSADEGSRVDRGRSPTGRSDVRGGKAGSSERDKRRARLENIPI